MSSWLKIMIKSSTARFSAKATFVLATIFTLVIFDSRIICRMICESMLSTKMQKLLQCCCLGEPDCLTGIMLLF